MILKLGDRSTDVKSIQAELKVAVTGDFDNETELAVKKWQAENGLSADGVVGPNTWNKLFPEDRVNEPLTVVTTSPQTLNIESLKYLLPENIYNELPTVIEKFNINNRYRLAHLLAQCCYESRNFQVLEENLNYSADGLLNVFPEYFPDSSKADRYAHIQEKIANYVYGNRLGNGPEDTGDGWLYRGRGAIQLTGKYNYIKLGEYIGINILANPTSVATDYALLSGAFFFNERKIWTICDGGVSDSVIMAVTSKVNSSLLGLENRASLLAKFYTALKGNTNDS